MNKLGTLYTLLHGAPTRKINVYFNNLVGTKRLKYMLTFLVGIMNYGLLPHSDLQALMCW